MKTITYILSLIIICSAISVSGCANTANGFHNDWRNNMQKMADETN